MTGRHLLGWQTGLATVFDRDSLEAEPQPSSGHQNDPSAADSQAQPPPPTIIRCVAPGADLPGVVGAAEA
jgi:hypothetical protein